MLRAVIGLALLLAAMPAKAQVTAKTIAKCGNENTDISIAACTAMLQAKPPMLEDYRLAAYYYRGSNYSEKGLQDLAIADFTSAIRLEHNPANLGSLYGAIGLAYYQKRLFAESIANFSKMIELRPDDVDGYRGRGSAYEQSEQRDKAIADYRIALKLDPDARNVKDALNRLGVAP